MIRLSALVVLGAGLLGSGLVGASTADGEPERPSVEVVESGSVLRADLRTSGTGVAGSITSERVTAIRRTA